MPNPDLKKLSEKAKTIAATAYGTYNIVDETLGGKSSGRDWHEAALIDSQKTAVGAAAVSGMLMKKKKYAAAHLKNGKRIAKLKEKAFIRCGDSTSIICYLLAKDPDFAECPIHAVMQGDPQTSGHWFVLCGDPDGFASLASDDWDKEGVHFPESAKCFTVDLWGANLVTDRAYLKKHPDPKSYADLRKGLIASKPVLVHFPGRAFVSCEKKTLTFWPVWPIPAEQIDDADGWND